MGRKADNHSEDDSSEGDIAAKRSLDKKKKKEKRRSDGTEVSGCAGPRGRRHNVEGEM